MKLLIGNFGSRNIGDELILSAALDEYGAENCIVMTHDPEFSQKFCGKRFRTMPFVPTGGRSFLKFLLKREYRNSIWDPRVGGDDEKRLEKGKYQERAEVEEIIFPGGGLLAIKFRAVLLWFLVFLWIKLLFKGVSINFLSQGVDQKLGFMSKTLARFVLNLCEEITVRDAGSKQAAQVICGKNVENVGDIVFNRLREEERESGRAGQLDSILINARTQIDHELWDRVSGLADQRARVIVFVAFDPKDLDCVPKEFKGEVVYPQTKSEVLDLFAFAQMAVGERLHFLICANKFCDQVLTLRDPYSEKVESFCAQEKIPLAPFDKGECS